MNKFDLRAELATEALSLSFKLNPLTVSRISCLKIIFL